MRNFFSAVFLVSVVLFASTIYSQRLESPIKVYSQRLETPVKIVRPDLSGKWKLNLQKSHGPHGEKAGPGESVTWFLIIEPQLPAVFVTVKSLPGVRDDTNFPAGRHTLYTDGRGDVLIGAQIVTSTTEWRDNKLVTTKYTSRTNGKTLFSIREIELGADGNSLIQTSRYSDKICGVNIGVLDDHRDYLIFERVK